MRPVSDAFLRTLTGSHRVVHRARVVTGHQTGTAPTGTEIPILGGDVTYDASAQIRATLDLTTDPALWPSRPTDLLAPYGAEIYVERGLVLGGGQEVIVSQGYYRIEDVDQDDLDAPVRISGRDRMAGIIDARLEAPRAIPANTTVEAVFDELVLDVYPDATIEFDFDAASTTFTGSHVCERDRYGFLADLVRSLGKIWYWDHRGVLVVSTPPDATMPVWTVGHGKGGVLVSAGRSRTRRGVYTAVVAIGEAPGDAPPVRAVARDLNPLSPTRHGGPFGKVPRFYTSPFVTTVPQAEQAAAALLLRSTGLPYSVDFQAIVNPALEVLDPVTITYTDRDRVEVHVLDQLSIPLTAATAMAASTRVLSESGDVHES